MLNTQKQPLALPWAGRGGRAGGWEAERGDAASITPPNAGGWLAPGRLEPLAHCARLRPICAQIVARCDDWAP